MARKLKKEKGEPKKDLTGPTFLEMYVYGVIGT